MINEIIDLRDIIIFILYNEKENNILEAIERDIAKTRHIQYYRELLYNKSKINNYIVTSDVYEIPCVLADNGMVVFNNLDIDKRKEEGNAIVWFPDQLTNEQINYLYKMLNQFHYFSNIKCNRWDETLRKRVDFNIDFIKYIEDEYRKISHIKTLKR